MKKNKFLATLLMTSCAITITLNSVNLSASAAYSTEQQAEIVLWDNYIKENSQEPFGYISRGNISMSAQEYQNAILDFDKAIALNKYSTDAYIKRADAKFMLNDLNGALKDYAIALEINKSLPDARFNVGRIFYKAQDYNRAIQNMRLGVQLAPENPQYRFELARAEYKGGLYKNAAKNFDVATQLRPEFIEAYYGSALAKINSADYAGAITAFDKVIASGEVYDNASYYKGLAEYQIADYNSAVKDFTDALKVNPQDAMAYNSRGKAYEILGKTSNAKKDYKKAQSLGLSAIGLTEDEKARLEQVATNKSVEEKVVETAQEKPVEVVKKAEKTRKTFTNMPEEQNVQATPQETTQVASQVKTVKEETPVKTVPSVAVQVAEQEVVREAKPQANEVVTVEQSKPSVVDLEALRMEEQLLIDDAVLRRLAGEKVAKGDVYTAVSYYDEDLTHRPDRRDNYIERANLKLKVKDYQGILKDTDVALEIDDDNAEASYLQGIAYEGQQNDMLAYRSFASAFKEFPHNPQYQFKFAESALNNGKFAEAEELATMLIESENVSDYPLIYVIRGKARHHMGEYYSAIADYTKYLEAHKKASKIYALRGLAKDELGVHKDAVKDFSKAVKYDRKNIAYRSYRARAYSSMHKYRKASANYKKIISMKGKYATLDDFKNVADTEVLRDRPEEALIYYDSILQRDHLNDKVYLERARVYAGIGKSYNAINDYTTVLRLNPAQIIVYKERGVLLVKTKAFRKGLMDLDIALEQEPNNGKLYYYRALAKQGIGNKEGALEDFETARKFEAL